MGKNEEKRIAYAYQFSTLLTILCLFVCSVYTIIAPKQIRPNATYEVSLTYVVKDDAVETAPLVRLKIDDSSQKQIVSRDVHLISNATNSVALPTDGVEYYKYYHFIAEGVEGIQLKHNVSLRTETKNVSILIQTDKAIYKPADTIRFRVLVLNSKTTPAALREKDLTVFIKVSIAFGRVLLVPYVNCSY